MSAITCRGRIRPRWSSLLLTVIGAACIPHAALADPFEIIFQDVTAGPAVAGAVSYAGGSSPLTGAVAMNTLTGINAPANSGSYAVNGGLFAFQTGAFDAGASSQGVYVFDPGGYFLLTGAVPSAGINSSTTLALGLSLGAIFDAQSDLLSFTIDVGGDVKNQQLLDFFGYTGPNAFLFGSLLLSTPVTTSSGNPNPSFSNLPVVTGITNPNTGGTIYSTVVNVAPVPEPASVVLLGTCMLSIIFRVRLKNAVTAALGAKR